MPIPKPVKKQTQKDFISSCMGNPTMVKEYKDIKQRYAICLHSFEEKKSKASIVFENFDGNDVIFFRE